MERLKKGEKYWHIGQWGDILMDYEGGSPIDDWLFQYGNYFATEEQAESMAKKLRAVLKGADVIEMPSKPLGLTEIKNNHLRSFVPERLSLNDLKAFALGFWEGCSWIASKIVK